MTDKPQTNPYGDNLPWEESQKPKGWSNEVWEWWCEIREAMKRHDWEKVKKLSKRWSI